MKQEIQEKTQKISSIDQRTDSKQGKCDTGFIKKFQNGDHVTISWNDKSYQGIVDRKMTKNWAVVITSEHWPHQIKFASVPEEYIRKSDHVDKMDEIYEPW